jgi:hypothetical protein
LRDGRVIKLDQPHLRGGSRDPLSREELARKCRENARFGGWSAERAEKLLEFGANIHRAADLLPFAGICREKGER